MPTATQKMLGKERTKGRTVAGLTCEQLCRWVLRNVYTVHIEGDRHSQL